MYSDPCCYWWVNSSWQFNYRTITSSQDSHPSRATTGVCVFTRHAWAQTHACIQMECISDHDNRLQKPISHRLGICQTLLTRQLKTCAVYCMLAIFNTWRYQFGRLTFASLESKSNVSVNVVSHWWDAFFTFGHLKTVSCEDESLQGFALSRMHRPCLYKSW